MPVTENSEGQDTRRQIYRRLLRYTYSQAPIFILAIVCMIIVALTEASFAALMKPLMDDAFAAHDSDTIGWIPLALMGIFFIRAVTSFTSVYGMSYIGRTIIHKLRREMFERMLQFPKDLYDRSTTGELIAKYTFDVEQVANAATKVITILIKDTVTVLALVGWMFYLSMTMATTFVVVGPFLALLVTIVARRFRRISTRIQGSMGDISRVLEETIKAQLVVKIFGGQRYEKQQFEAVNDHNRKQNLKLVMTSASSTPIIQFIVAIALAFIIFMATREEALASHSPGVFASFMIAMFMLFAPIRQLTTVNAELQKGLAAAESVFDFIDQHTEIDEGDFEKDRVEGRIRFESLTFRYDEASRDVLSDIELNIEPGMTVAFVGRSGSGKSTLVNLLPRMYPLSEGRILLDDVDINDYTLANLRSQIAYVGQDVVLFNDTIEHNIAYGVLDDFTHDQVVEAAVKAHALEFIERSSEGFGTIVGERGVLLSGGQRQRIAIARAILKDSPILILDEATSALDNESERYIQESLNQLMQGRTTLVIAHRLSTIENADLIVVMDEGRIVERGTHENLLARKGHYASLHNLQFTDEEQP